VALILLAACFHQKFVLVEFIELGSSFSVRALFDPQFSGIYQTQCFFGPFGNFVESAPTGGVSTQRDIQVILSVCVGVVLVIERVLRILALFEDFYSQFCILFAELVGI